MILVVAEQLSLRFLLQHQGRTIQSARTATEALRLLRNGFPHIQGIVLDERMENSKLVSGYVHSHAPGLQLISYQAAQRHSPFSLMPAPVGEHKAAGGDENRYVWDRSQSLR